MYNNIETKLRLESKFKKGMNWFYWIAALSIINSLVFYSGGNINFIVGLGITQLIDIFASELRLFMGDTVYYIGILVNIIIVGIYALIGYVAMKRKKWIIIVGVILYSFDTLIFIWAKDFISIGFHILAIVSIFKGYNSLKELLVLELKEADITDIVQKEELEMNLEV